jgi:hypothetical protein
MPPQSGAINTNTKPSYSHTLPWQASRSTAKAKQATAASFPGSRVTKMYFDGDGRPYKAYIRDAHGNNKTVMFDNNQNVTHARTGRC